MNAEERQRRDEEIARIQQEMAHPVQRPVARPLSESSSEEETSSSGEETSSSGEETSSSSSEEKKETTIESFPVFNPTAIPNDHSKAIKVLCWDGNRTRLVTGALDGTTSLWDTGLGMGATSKPFRQLCLTSATTGSATDQCVISLDFNRTNQLIAVGRRDAQIRIFDRDGTNGRGEKEAKHTTTLGDVSLWDMKKTKGHVGAVSQVSFSHTKDHVLFSSGEMDGTIRIWDLEKGPKALMGLELACTHTLLYPAKPGMKNSIQAFCHNKDSVVLFAGTGSGLRVWDARIGGGVFGALPTLSVLWESTAVSLAVDPSDQMLLAGKKDVVEEWDVRNLKSPVWAFKSLSPVRSATYDVDGSVSVACASDLVFLRARTGAEIGRTSSSQATSSNLVSDCRGKRPARFILGKQDGSLVVSFAKDFIPPVAAAAAALSSPTSAPSYYARVDASRVADNQGEIMPISEALKLVKGTKRMKNDLRDDI
ncbi:hypothetical protein BASA81_004728 [Batrachochytrium salamandrivorans]|nr:hypothetical protein BASA81_004728 [Batrachochytrium salamandrivorans]